MWVYHNLLIKAAFLIQAYIFLPQYAFILNYKTKLAMFLFDDMGFDP